MGCISERVGRDLYDLDSPVAPFDLDQPQCKSLQFFFKLAFKQMLLLASLPIK